MWPFRRHDARDARRRALNGRRRNQTSLLPASGGPPTIDNALILAYLLVVSPALTDVTLSLGERESRSELDGEFRCIADFIKVGTLPLAITHDGDAYGGLPRPL